jgi:hypothetical protein
MSRIIALFFASALLLPDEVGASEPVDALCKPLLAFVGSVRSGDAQEFTLHTIWGQNFNDSSVQAMFGKRCEHGGYGPAQELCRYFVQHSAAEFAALNARRTLHCLSPSSHISKEVSIERGTFSLTYDSPKGTNAVTIVFDEDRKLGGMALRVVSKGD